MLSCFLLVPAQDMLDIIDMEGVREPNKYPTKQGGFDLIWDGSAVAAFDKPTSYPSMLGCYNPNDQNQVRRTLQELQAEAAAAAGTPSKMAGKHVAVRVQAAGQAG